MDVFKKKHLTGPYTPNGATTKRNNRLPRQASWLSVWLLQLYFQTLLTRQTQNNEQNVDMKIAVLILTTDAF